MANLGWLLSVDTLRRGPYRCPNSPNPERFEHRHEGVYSALTSTRNGGPSEVEACLNDAKEGGMNGVAVVIREGPWLADRRLFLANGFELVDTAPPDYELLIRKLKASAADPAFK